MPTSKGLFTATYAASLALFLVGLHGGMYWHDSPEFILTSRFLAPAHPAGSPGYSLAAHLLTFIPLGPIASRVAMLSTVSSALIAALIGSILAGRSSGRTGLLTSFLVLGLYAASPTLATYASVPEVYPLHALILIASWITASRRKEDPRWGALSLALLALSLTVHFSTVFYLPAFAGAWMVGGAAGGNSRKAIGIGLIGAALMISTHAFLALRSDPSLPLYWGDLRDPANLIAHVTARTEQGYMWSFSWHDLPPQILELIRKVRGELSIVALLAACLGVAAGVRNPSGFSARRTAAVALLGLSLAAHAFFFMRFESFPTQYCLVWMALVAAAAGGGAWFLGMSVPLRSRFAGWGVFLLALASILEGSQTLAAIPRFAQERLVDSALDQIPPGGLLVHSGQLHFQSQYLRFIESRRPDVSYFHLLREGHFQPPPPDFLTARSTDRPLRIGNEVDPLRYTGTELGGTVYTLYPSPQDQSRLRISRSKWLSTMQNASSWRPLDFPTYANWSRATAAIGRWHLSKHETGDASQCYELSLKINPKYASGHAGLAATAQVEGRRGEAQRHYLKALELVSPISSIRPSYEAALESLRPANNPTPR